jgi:hypothetical protein
MLVVCNLRKCTEFDCKLSFIFYPVVCTMIGMEESLAVGCLFRFLNITSSYQDKSGFALAEFLMIMSYSNRVDDSNARSQSASLQTATIVSGNVISIDSKRSIFFNTIEAPQNAPGRFIPRSLGPGFANTLVVLDLTASHLTGTIPDSVGLLVCATNHLPHCHPSRHSEA